MRYAWLLGQVPKRTVDSTMTQLGIHNGGNAARGLVAEGLPFGALSREIEQGNLFKLIEDGRCQYQRQRIADEDDPTVPPLEANQNMHLSGREKMNYFEELTSDVLSTLDGALQKSIDNAVELPGVVDL